MAASPLSPQDLQKIRDFAAQWGKIIARRAFGDAGPGLDCDLLALEHVAQAAAQGLLEGTLSTLLEQQVQALPDEQPCPDCQRPCRVTRAPRPLDCRGGTLTYQEPVAHCPACRRDFFPPAARLAPGRPPIHP
jgi:hypothetical protein